MPKSVAALCERWHMKFDRQFEKLQHYYKIALE